MGRRLPYHCSGIWGDMLAAAAEGPISTCAPNCCSQAVAFLLYLSFSPLQYGRQIKQQNRSVNGHLTHKDAEMGSKHMKGARRLSLRNHKGEPQGDPTTAVRMVSLKTNQQTVLSADKSAAHGDSHSLPVREQWHSHSGRQSGVPSKFKFT